MTDFSRLLKDAAGSPPRPLDMATVRARAARLRRRTGLWLLGAIGVAGVGVPTGVAVLPSTDRPAQVETVDPERDQTSDRDRDPTPIVRRSAQSTTPAAAETGEGTSHAPLPVRDAAVAGTTTTAPGRATTGEEGCELEGDWFADRRDADFPTCTYTATLPAGYEALGGWEMTIVKPDGTTRTERQCHDPNIADDAPCTPAGFSTTATRCENVGYIEVGDRVTIKLYDGGHGPPLPPHGGHGPPPYFRAGPGHHC